MYNSVDHGVVKAVARVFIRCASRNCNSVITTRVTKLDTVADTMTRYGWGMHESKLLCPRCLRSAIGDYPAESCAACDQTLQSDEVGPFGANCLRSIENLNLSRDLTWGDQRTRSQIWIRHEAANKAWETRRHRESQRQRIQR